MSAQPDFVVSTLKEAVDVIERIDRPEPPPMPVMQPSVDLRKLEETSNALLAEFRAWRTELPAALAKLPRPMVNVAAPATPASMAAALMPTKKEPPFSITKMLAGLAQMGAIACLAFAYLHRADAVLLQTILLVSLCVQSLTISLLIMDRQR